MANQNFRVKNGLEVGSVQIASDGGVINSSALPDSGASAGTTGSSSAIPVITVNAKGLVTNVQSAAVSGVDSFVYTPANTTFVLTSGGSPLAQTIIFGSEFTTNATGVHIEKANSTMFSNSTGLAVNVAAISITGLAGYDANDHIDHSTVSVLAGNGLTGGGTIAADRTLAVGAGDAIVVNSTAVSVNSGAIDITSLANYDANKFIDHTGVTLTAGNGLTGGGTIAASRSFAVKANTGITANSSGVFTDDSAIDHDTLSGFVANEHIDHSSVTMTAGNGLTGGGDLTTTRTFNVGSGNGISVTADGLDVVGGTGLVSNASGVHVAVSNGLEGSASYLRVLAGTGVVSNATGVHIGQAVGTSDDVTFNDLVV